MTFINANFEKSIETLDTSISMILTIGEHDDQGWPIPSYSYAFGCTESTIKNQQYQVPLNIYPYLMGDLNVSQSLDVEQRRHIISNVNIKLANQNILSIGNQDGEYSLMSDIFLSKFPNSEGQVYNSILNSHSVIWLVTGSSAKLTDCVPIFRGVVRDVSYTKDKLSIKLEDHMAHILEREIPIKQMPDTNIGSFEDFNWGIEDDMKNKVVPLTLGKIRHAEPIFYHDYDTQLEFDEQLGAVGFSKWYLINDRVGQFFPNENIYLLAHDVNSPISLLDYMNSAGNTSGNSTDFTYQSTSLSVFKDNEWQDVIDIKDAWIGGLYMKDYSFDTLDSQEIEISSYWEIDSELGVPVPTTTFANDTIFFFYNAQFAAGNWLTAGTMNVWQSWETLIDLLPPAFTLAAVTIANFDTGFSDSQLSPDGSFFVNNNWQDVQGTFDPNKGLWRGYSSMVESPALIMANTQDCLAANWINTIYENLNWKGYIGATLDNDHLDAISFDEWLIIMYYDVAFKTATQDEIGAADDMFVNSEDTTLGGLANVAANISFSCKFLYTDSVIQIDNIFEEGYQVNGHDWVNDDNNYYMAANYWNNSASQMTDEFHEDTATDWVRVKNKVVIGDKPGWEFGLPRGMGFRCAGIHFSSWSGETGYPTSSAWKGGVRARIHDLLVAYMVGQAGIYRDLRVLSNGRGTGLTNGANPLTDPTHSVVVSLDGADSRIENPVSMIVHLLEKEIGIDFGQQLSDNIINAHFSHSADAILGDELGHNSSAWVLNLNLTNKTKVRQVFEDIAQTSLTLPIIRTAINGGFELRFWFLKESFQNIIHPEVPIFGCTVDAENILNYNPYATLNDGSCLSEDGSEIIIGCTDNALGQWPDINGLCREGQLPFNSNGDPELEWANNQCFDTPQANGLHSGLYGYWATNYNPLATNDDASCDYSYLGGCNDPAAFNYDEEAEWNDGTCYYEPTVPLESLFGCFDVVNKYYTYANQNINYRFPNSYNRHTPAGPYKEDAVEFIRKDFSGLLQRSYTHFAKYMYEWGIYNSFNIEDDLGIPDQGWSEALMCLVGYTFEIYTYKKGDSVADYDNRYHSIFRFYYLLPKANDYFANDTHLMSNDVEIFFSTDYHFDPTSFWIAPDGQACPEWFGYGYELNHWWQIQLLSCQIEDDEVATPYDIGWPLQYDMPRTFGSLMDEVGFFDSEVNMPLYDAWTYLIEGSTAGDWEATLMAFITGFPEAINSLYWLAYNSLPKDSLVWEQIGITNPPENYYQRGDLSSDLFIQNIIFTSTAYGWSYGADEKHHVPWLWDTPEYHWYGYGAEVSCQREGLRHMGQWTSNVDWGIPYSSSGFLNLEEYYHLFEDSTVADGNFMDRIHKLTWVGRGDHCKEIILNEIASDEGYDIHTHHYKSLAYYEHRSIDGLPLPGDKVAQFTSVNVGLDDYSDILNDITTRQETRESSLFNIYGDNDWHIIAPFGNYDNDQALYGQGMSRANRIITGESSTTRSSRDYASDIDRLINSKEVIDYKVYQSKPDKICSRVKVQFDHDKTTGTFYQETDWEYWYEPSGIMSNWSIEFGAAPIGDELLNYYGLDQTGYDDDGTPSIYAATSKVIQLKNTADLPTAEKVRRAHLGLNMNQHTMMDLTLPLKYSNIELGDYVAIDFLIQGQKAYGEDYSLDHYVQTKNQENPQGVHNIRNGQIIYPLFLVEKIKYSLKNVKITINQVHDWTGLMSHTGASPGDGDYGITLLNTRNSFNGSTSITQYIQDYNDDGTLSTGTVAVSQNKTGVRRKTAFKFTNEMAAASGQSWKFYYRLIKPQLYTQTAVNVENGMDTNLVWQQIDESGVVNSGTYPSEIVNSIDGYYHIFHSAGVYEVWSEDDYGSESAKSYIHIVEQGDVNGDRLTNIQDIILQVQTVLGNMSGPTSCTDVTNINELFENFIEPHSNSLRLEASDRNLDGTMDILDIIETVNQVLEP